MKIFIFSTHIYFPTHKETELELIQNHLDKGDEVYRFYCDGYLPTCDVNPNHALLTCLKCRDARLQGNKLLDGKINELPLIIETEAVAKQRERFIFNYTSLKELQDIKVNGFDAGYAASSSFISLVREPEPDVLANKEIIDDFLHSSIAVYFSALNYIRQLEPSLIYLFNGRLAHVRPVLRAAQQSDIDCYIHERGHGITHYGLFKNTSPHDRTYVVNQMLLLWDKADPAKREALGKEFYEERFKGADQAWMSFTKNQDKGTLPKDWNPSKRNIGIYNSSEDEFAAIGPDWKNDLYNTQIDGIKKIVSNALKYPDLHFYLRVHPNLSGLYNSEIQSIERLKFLNLTVIPAASPLSTYDLLLNCEKIISFGSSIGIEAVYWGVPSILAGKSYIYELNATYRPQSHDELMKMLVEKLQPMDKTPALIFGYYFKSFGIPFTHYIADNPFGGKFKNIDLYKRLLISTRVFIKIFSQRPLKPVLRILEQDFQTKKRHIYKAFTALRF